MDAILHKLCEKAQQELWDLLKENNWSKDHAEVAYYMVEIVKAAKKMEHMKRMDEEENEQDAPYRYEQNGNGGRSSGGRGSSGGGGNRNNYEYTPRYEDEEWDREKDKIVAKHFEKRYKEMLEDRWEKEKNERQNNSRMPPLPPSPVK